MRPSDKQIETAAEMAALKAEAEQEARDRRLDEVEERFERDVEIVRGAGGFAPTTADLQWLGEARAYAAMGSEGDAWAAYHDQHEDDLEMMRQHEAQEYAAWEGRSRMRKLADALVWYGWGRWRQPPGWRRWRP